MGTGRQTFIIIGCVAGLIALPFQGFYSAAKAALASYEEALRIELRPFNGTVTLVESGDHHTSFPDRREAQHHSQNNPHEPQQSRVLAEMVASEAAGTSAESFAERVTLVVASKYPQRHYFKMSALERMDVVLRAVLPSAWIEAAIRRADRLD